MTTFLMRATAGAIALLFAAAAIDVPGARAQTIFPTVDGTTSTTCGAGTVVSCGSQVIMKCEHSIQINVNLFARDAGIKIVETNCQPAGTRTLFKDQTATAPCSSSGGSRGSGLTGTRGSGEDDGGDFCV